MTGTSRRCPGTPWRASSRRSDGRAAAATARVSSGVPPMRTPAIPAPVVCSPYDRSRNGTTLPNGRGRGGCPRSSGTGGAGGSPRALTRTARRTCGTAPPPRQWRDGTGPSASAASWRRQGRSGCVPPDGQGRPGGRVPPGGAARTDRSAGPPRTEPDPPRPAGPSGTRHGDRAPGERAPSGRSQGTSTETVSATQTGLSPPSRSIVTRTTARAPSGPRSTESSSTPARIREPTGTGAGKRTLLDP